MNRSVSLACFLGCLMICPTLGVADQGQKPLRVSCSVVKGNCWRSLAKAALDHPKVSHFDVRSTQDTGGYAVANSVMQTSREHRWFYNRRLTIVDYAVTYYEPPDNWAVVNQRSRFSNITSVVFKQVLARTPNLKDSAFAPLATANGVQIKAYITDLNPVKHGVN